MCSKVSGFAPLFVIILLDHNLHLLTVAARSKIRFSETLGHGWFGWVVSGTVAGATKVFLFLRKILKCCRQAVVKILREEAKPEELDRFTQVKE